MNFIECLRVGAYVLVLATEDEANPNHRPTRYRHSCMTAYLPDYVKWRGFFNRSLWVRHTSNTAIRSHTTRPDSTNNFLWL